MLPMQLNPRPFEWGGGVPRCRYTGWGGITRPKSLPRAGGGSWCSAVTKQKRGVAEIPSCCRRCLFSPFFPPFFGGKSASEARPLSREGCPWPFVTAVTPSSPSGFGPFGEHAVNASWVAVQELEKLGLRDDVDLHVYEVPVEYQTVQRLIPALWKKHSPQLVVHVGVSGMATTVTLEKCGHNVGYKGLDNCRFCPGSQCCVEGGPECIDSIIDMDTVCKRVSALGLDVTVTISKDAGRYLCDFTYYTSLYQSRGRSAFVHVPPLGKPYTAEQLGRALQAIIEEMLDVLEHSEDKINCQHEH
uniref:Pyroglutamyl-peptidase I n=1 Tax=Cairina moschata TaxID=8855 RepID=A0A8C3GGJ5_CAIMO